MAMTPDITGGLDCEESRIPRLKPIEESLQKLVQKAFASRGEGYTTCQVANGGEGPTKISTDAPSLVLLDLICRTPTARRLSGVCENAHSSL